MPTPAIRNLIREGKTHQIYSSLQTGSNQGMQTMDAALATLVRAGHDQPEARRVAVDDARGAAPPAWAGAARGLERMSSTYVFKAIDLVGLQSKGEVEAESKQAVNDQLKSRGLIVLDIADKRGSKEIKLPWSNRVKAGDLAIMTRQLSTMVSSGMTILRALYVLEAPDRERRR